MEDRDPRTRIGRAASRELETTGVSAMSAPGSSLEVAESEASDTLNEMEKAGSYPRPDPRVQSVLARGVAHKPVALPPLPQIADRQSKGPLITFFLFVVFPFLAFVIYYYAFAANQYTTEFRFSVTQVNPSLPSVGPSSSTSSSSGSGGAMTAMAGMASSMGMSVSSGSPQNYIVVDYLTSPQVVEDLMKHLDLRKMYSSDRAGWDFWASLSPKVSNEKLVDYWNHMISANFDPITGLAFAKVRAFTPQDALAIGNELVALSEMQVNRIGQRAADDGVKFAKSEVDRAQKRLDAAQLAMSKFRDKEGVIDPSMSVGSNSSLRTSLRASIVQAQSDLQSLLSQHLSGQAPGVILLRAQIAAQQDQLNKMEREISKSTLANRALSDVVGRYETLDQDRQYAQAMLIASNQAYDQARASAAAQHLYLTPYVLPALPDSTTYPNRPTSLLVDLIGLLGFWTIGYLAHKSISENF